jgi:putative transposase
MPRANRYFMPGYVWHITHRCHQKDFLLKFSKDRKRWLYWLFEARKRFGLCVLNYIVTSNHIHLLALDRGKGEIAKSMQLIAGRTAQEYNQRKKRLGAYWQDRYHATAVDTDGYLTRCMAYIDLNMVRAGVVAQPMEWEDSGYREIRNPPERYQIIDANTLMDLLTIPNLKQLQQKQDAWISEALRAENTKRDHAWSNSIAIGTPAFVERIHAEMGMRVRHREITEHEDAYLLEEVTGYYKNDSEAKNSILRLENAVIIDEYL